MPGEKTAIIKVKLNIKTGEILEKEIVGYSEEEIHWVPLLEMLYQEIKAQDHKDEEGA